jgi:hypothetical protein
MHWHKNLSGFIRYASEPAAAESPHLVCRHVGGGGSLCFDVHAPGSSSPVYTNLSFAGALAAFLHVVFVRNLPYPEDGEAVAVWLQRRVAGICDEGEEKFRKGRELFDLMDSVMRWIFFFKV